MPILIGRRGQLGELAAGRGVDGHDGGLGLELLAPETIDAYVPASRLDGVTSEHGLESVPTSEANVILRAVPDDAWMLDERHLAPRAAVGLDLASYPDSRSARVGTEVLAGLDASRRAAG